MASGVTNKGARKLLARSTRGEATPTNFYVALVTSAVAPTVDTNTLSELTEIAAGNGYTSGGISLTPNSTDFDFIEEDDTNNWARVQIKDLVWTAASGPIPASGNGARYAVLLDDNATVGSREVYAWWDLSSDRTVSDGQTLTLQDCEIKGTPA